MITLIDVTSEIRKNPGNGDGTRSYLIELDQDEFDFLKNTIEDEITSCDTVKTTRMFVHLLEKLEEAEQE